MSDKYSSSNVPGTPSSDGAAIPASEAPTVAGGLIIPDLSALATLQNDNMQKMTAAVQSAAQGLEGIVSLQKETLQQALGGLQTSLDGSVTTAWAGPGKVPDVQSQINNLTLTIDSLNKAAETLTASTSKSFDAINQSMEKSLASIEQVAEKFSSGG